MEWLTWVAQEVPSQSDVCLPLWVTGAVTAPLLTAIGVLWRSLLIANSKTEERYDRILRRMHEFQEDGVDSPQRNQRRG